MRFQVGSMADAWDELQPLAAAHWQEVQGHLGHRVQLDRETLLGAERCGRLSFVEARDEAGRLGGYAVVLLVAHPHATGLRVAEVNALYLDPPNRCGTNAHQLIACAHAAAMAAGCEAIYQAAPAAGRVGTLLRSLGYQVADVLYMHRLKGVAHG